MRIVVLVCIYAAIIAFSFYFAYEIRFDFMVPLDQSTIRFNIIGFVLGIKLLSMICTNQVRTLITFFAVPDLFQIFLSMSIVSSMLLVARFVQWGPAFVPRGVILVDYLLCIGGLCCFRLGARLFRERVMTSANTDNRVSTRIAIVGAGNAGSALAKELLSFPSRGIKPVAFFDDNPTKRNQLLHGIPVLGRPEDMRRFVKPYGIVEAIIAMSSASNARVNEIVREFASLRIKVETLPSLDTNARGRLTANSIRPIEIEDLLGREPISLDQSGIHAAVSGKIVLVTGAAGSIGSELCRQLAKFAPAKLLMLDQSEPGLFFLEREFSVLGNAGFASPLIADVVDAERLNAIFEKYRPNIVFHAAAYKHVFMMERQYTEAFRTNVIGTREIAECASRYKTAVFVLVSTDKAVNPTSIMGTTKRLAEIQIQEIQSRASNQTKYMAVRFGNVLGSSGSVVPLFRKQISEGGPITITHPEVKRYFMTISEAAGLVVQASVLGNGGDIFLLDMGEPVKIYDLAKQMAELSGLRLGEDIEVRYIGLRAGEKMFEELRYDTEEYDHTAHPRLFRLAANKSPAPAIGDRITTLELKCYSLGKNEFSAELARLVPEYTPFIE